MFSQGFVGNLGRISSTPPTPKLYSCVAISSTRGARQAQGPHLLCGDRTGLRGGEGLGGKPVQGSAPSGQPGPLSASETCSSKTCLRALFCCQTIVYERLSPCLHCMVDSNGPLGAP